MAIKQLWIRKVAFILAAAQLEFAGPIARYIHTFHGVLKRVVEQMLIQQSA